jgi:4-hydroxy-3-polyprenylbenzoate decarboxylase
MKRLIIGITGASGIAYAVRLLEALRGKAETHCVISPAAEKILHLEMDRSPAYIRTLVSAVYDYHAIEAPLSSGTFLTDGMVIIPCSIKTLSAVANSYSDSLLVRAADVTLKEGRKLILAIRETPLHIGHLELMNRAALMGATIFPLCPGFYFKPTTVDDMLNHLIGKVLDLVGVGHSVSKRWGSQRGPIGAGLGRLNRRKRPRN